MNEEYLLQQISKMLDEKLDEKLEEKLEKKLEEKLEEKLDKKLDEKLDLKLKDIREDIQKLKKDVSEVKEDIAPMKVTCLKVENELIPKIDILFENRVTRKEFRQLQDQVVEGTNFIKLSMKVIEKHSGKFEGMKEALS